MGMMVVKTITRESTVDESIPERENPLPWLRHLGLLNDYVRVPYANGSSFASQFLRREFRARGHDVTIIGPYDPEARPEQMPDRYLLLKALPMRNHPGVYMPFPTRKELANVAAQRFDLLLAQAGSELNELGVWLRATQNVPFVCVNTLHLPSVYNVVLPDALLRNELVRKVFEKQVMPRVEAHAAQLYNESDALVVLSSGLARSWRERGVTVPIHVIPRSVDPRVANAGTGPDPFDPRAARGQRLLVVCRHSREKGVGRLLEIFAREVAPVYSNATLTLVGDGPDHDAFREQAKRLGVANRTFFVGEYPVTEVARFYQHADLFVYTSLSETYGQVVSEALWCGLPVVAFADEMGVSDQVEHEKSGYLLAPGPDQAHADAEFGAAVRRLLNDAEARAALGAHGSRTTRARTEPARVVARYYEAFAEARAHRQAIRFSPNKERVRAWRSLARWTFVQSLAVGLGYMRPPATLNRHGREQPTWGSV